MIVCAAGYVSGKEVMALTLAEGLRSSGRTVHLICSTWNDGDFGSRLELESIPHSYLPLGFISASPRWRYLRMTCEQMARWPGLLLDYARLLRRLAPARIVHTNWHHTLLLLPLLSRSRDVLWFHEVIPGRWQYKLVFSAFALRLRGFIAVSQVVADSLARSGVPAHRITIIHNGLRIADPPTRRIPVGEGIILGIVGQVGAWKGHDDLVEAFGLIAADLPGVRLVIFGRHDNPFAATLKAKIASLGLEERVRWAGFERQQEVIYGGIHICVVPSRSADPLPTSALEAGFFGLPVVATKCGGLPEIVEDGVTGLLVPPQDPASLAAAISRLASDGTYAAAMGERAQARMKALFSEQRFRSDFLKNLFALDADTDR